MPVIQDSLLWWIVGLAAIAGSFSATFWLYRMGEVHLVGRDRTTGVQKFHVNPTSRLGGLGIIAGYLAALVVIFLARRGQSSDIVPEFGPWYGLALASLPVFLGGLYEDLTHRVSPTVRLLLSVLSAAMVYWGLGIGVFHTDVWLVDILLKLPTAAFFVTLLVVAGFTHSINIIDGFHGLASGSVMIILVGLMALAWMCEDSAVLYLSGLLLLSTLGFFVLNWPRGRIFLGDAGAYLLGFWVVELGLFLVNRNPQISPMAPVVVGIFPLIETLFSMYRRKFVRQHPINHPDGLHLHTLIYKRLLAKRGTQKTPSELNHANSLVAPYFWAPSAIFVVLAVVFMESTSAQILLMLAYFGCYRWLYVRLVSLKTPKWMLRR
ncbi:MAG: glycosyltransferase [Sterolibacterium sp.]